MCPGLALPGHLARTWTLLNKDTLLSKVSTPSAVKVLLVLILGHAWFCLIPP